MSRIYEIVTYHVTHLDDCFGLKTLTFNHEEAANDFTNQLLETHCTFVHFYETRTVTKYLRDESSLYVCNP